MKNTANFKLTRKVVGVKIFCVDLVLLFSKDFLRNLSNGVAKRIPS